MPGSRVTSPFDWFSLEGRVALVTGGSRGIGRAIAASFAAAGAEVVIASRDAAAGAIVAGELEAIHGRRVVAARCDVARWAELDDLHDLVMTEFGRLDVLVNNAGASKRHAALVAIDEQDFDLAYDLNVKAAFRLGALAGTTMARQGGGAIVNVSSVSSLYPRPALAPYATAKASLNATTLCLAEEFAPIVRVNGLVLGPVATDATAHLDEQETSRYAASRLLRRFGTVDDVAGAALFLASDAASYVTGTLLRVDGGGVF